MHVNKGLALYHPATPRPWALSGEKPNLHGVQCPPTDSRHHTAARFTRITLHPDRLKYST
jgi:hypothetical protein